MIRILFEALIVMQFVNNYPSFYVMHSFYYHVYKTQVSYPCMDQFNPIRTLRSYFNNPHVMRISRKIKIQCT